MPFFHKSFLKNLSGNGIYIAFKTRSNFPRVFNINVTSSREKRVPFAASLTLEAALVMPLFIAAVMAVLVFVIVISTQVKVQKALYDHAMNVSGYAYYVGATDIDNTVESVLEESAILAGVISELGKDYLDNSFIVNGSKGLYLNLLVDQEADILDVAIQYQIRVPYDLLGIGRITLVSRVRCHTWGGDEETENNWDEEMVYVAKTGTVYHLYLDCPHLHSDISYCPLSRIETIRNASGGKYYECSTCGKNIGADNLVFYTEYGERYHTSVTCRQLLTTVFTMTKAKAIVKYPLCQKCRERSATQ